MHGTVSPMTKCFLFVTGLQKLGFGCRWYGQLFLAIAGFLVIESESKLLLNSMKRVVRDCLLMWCVDYLELTCRACRLRSRGQD